MVKSCTGGLVAKYITDIAGSSAWFDRGFVTYSNRSKQEMLGVDEQTLQENGAVSEAVVKQMALGALKRSAANYSIAVSGVAGPSGGSEAKPVGTVCFAWGLDNDQVLTETCHFVGDRESIREQAARYCLEKLSVNI